MTQRDELLREEQQVKRHVSYALQSYVQWGWRGDYQELRRELTQEAWLGLLLGRRRGQDSKHVDNAIRRALNRWWRREREWLEHVEVRSIDAPGL